MMIRDRWRRCERSPTGRTVLFVAGMMLMAVSPIIGALPGPGGVFVFAGGLGLTLKYSRRAKRHYVAFKRRWPRQGRWADWGLRRPSAKRRASLAGRGPSAD